MPRGRPLSSASASSAGTRRRGAQAVDGFGRIGEHPVGAQMIRHHREDPLDVLAAMKRQDHACASGRAMSASADLEVFEGGDLQVGGHVRHQDHRIPSRSTSCASSVVSRPAAASCARVDEGARKALRRLRPPEFVAGDCLPTMMPRSVRSASLRVRRPESRRWRAPPLRAISMICVDDARDGNGRAPSCTRITCAASGSAASPARTESVRSDPPATSRRDAGDFREPLRRFLGDIGRQHRHRVDHVGMGEEGRRQAQNRDSAQVAELLRRASEPRPRPAATTTTPTTGGKSRQPGRRSRTNPDVSVRPRARPRDRTR